MQALQFSMEKDSCKNKCEWLKKRAVEKDRSLVNLDIYLQNCYASVLF